MQWLNENKRSWRAAVLALLVLGILGPWAFDLINVPAEYTCSPPFIRLEGDYCGSPVLGIQIFSGLLLWSIRIPWELAVGAMDFSNLYGILWPGMLLLLPLPLVSNMLLILRENSRGGLLHLVVWGLAAAVLFLRIAAITDYHPVLWGSMLFFVIMSGGLFLEVLVLASGRFNRPA